MLNFFMTCLTIECMRNVVLFHLIKNITLKVAGKSNVGCNKNNRVFQFVLLYTYLYFHCWVSD